MKTRIAIIAAGLLGLAMVLQTGRYYAGIDGLAFLVTLAMGLALSCGVLEVFLVGRRLERVASEVDKLPGTAEAWGTEEPLGRLSPTLRALLQARLSGTATPPPAPVFAPFLTGLLIMLGLLGTFLGLFETLRGASIALTASADVDALRAGLQTPMQGLMRSFGTSACGVATSATLGAAVVVARRAAGSLNLRLYQLASGPLRHLSADHRQLSALQALAAQGQAWPEAATALATAAERLDGLRADWGAAHRSAAEDLSKSVNAVAAQVQTGVKEASVAVEGRLSTAVGRIQSAVEAGAAQAGDQAAAQIRDLVERAVSEAVEAATARWNEVQDGQGQSLRSLQSGVEGLLETQREQVAALATQQQAQATALVDAQRAQAETLAEQEQARAANLIERFEEGLLAWRGALAEAEKVQQARAEAISGSLSAAADDLGQVAEAVRGQAARQAQADEQQRAQATAALEQLAKTALAAQRAADEQQKSAQALVAGSDEQLQAVLDAGRERLDDALSSMQTQAEAHGERVAAQEAALVSRNAELTKELTAFAHAQRLRLETHEDEQRVRQEESLSALADLLASHLRKLDERVVASTGLLETAGGLVQAGGTELVTVAETFSAAVDAQRQAAEAWLESLGEIERSVTDAGEAAAADVLGQHLARTHEVFDRQLRFQQELMEQLRKNGSDGIVAAPMGADGSA